MNKIIAIFLEQHRHKLSLPVLLEALLNEQIELGDWETSDRWSKDAEGGSADRKIETTYEKISPTVTPGESVIRGTAAFLPTLSLTVDQIRHALAYMLTQAKKQGMVNLSLHPGEATGRQGSIPAQFIKPGALPAEDLHEIEQSRTHYGPGGIIYAVNDMPLSQVLRSPVDVTERAKVFGHEEGDVIGVLFDPHKKRQLPEWLLRIEEYIRDIVASGKVNAETAGIPGFADYIMLHTHEGNAILLIATKKVGDAAYVFKKVMTVEKAGRTEEVPWHQAIGDKMNEFVKEYKGERRQRRRPTEEPGAELETGPAAVRQAQAAMRRAGEEMRAGRGAAAAGGRQPRLRLRDWLRETDNGYALRRDFREADIKRIIDAGITYESGIRIAESVESAARDPIAEIASIIEEF